MLRSLLLDRWLYGAVLWLKESQGQHHLIGADAGLQDLVSGALPEFAPT